MIKEYVVGECRKNGIGMPTEATLEEFAVGLVNDLTMETEAAAKQLIENEPQRLS